MTFSLIIGLLGCTPPGGNRKIPQVKVTIQNTLPIKRRDVPIILTLAELRKAAPDFSFGAYQVVPGRQQNENPLHSQVDDVNYDGQKDELVFLIDLEPQETKEVSIRYAPEYPMALTFDFTKRTRAGIFPELSGLAALESESVAYLLKPNGSIHAYGKRGEALFSMEPILQSDLDFGQPSSPELRRVFQQNNIQLSQNTVIEIQKRESRWVITDQESGQKYFVRKDGETLNVYKSNGLSIDRFVRQTITEADENDAAMSVLASLEAEIGCGGFALWDKTAQKYLTPPEKRDYVRIIANGPIRSIVQRVIPNWNLRDNSVKLTATVSIYGGNHWIEQRINVQALPNDYSIATGVPDLGISAKDEDKGWVSAWREQTSKLGMGVIYPIDRFDTFHDSKVIMNPNESGDVIYYAFAVWSEEVTGLQTKQEFDEYVELTAKQIHTPPVIRLLPLTEEK